MLNVNYITRPWFFDISVEFIREFKQQVNLTVILVVSPQSSAYLGLTPAEAELYLDKTLPLAQVLKGELYNRLNPYFEGAKVICKFEQHKESHYKNALGWRNLLRKNPALLNADFNIIETLSLADWYFLIRLRRKQIYYIIHDPQPHTGEGRSRTEKINNLYFPKIQKFITYSQFSTRLFKQHYPAYANKVLTFKMPVFTSQKVELKTPPPPSANKKIVFFGRLSQYKGVELFYEAAVKLSAQHSNVNFIIAGKAYEGYNPDFLQHNTKPAITIRNRFIGLEELAEIMTDADLCVLPYFDATQSGVIMTCYAFNLPVLVSNCEGLVEYCFDKEHFSFENKNVNSLIEKMQTLINNPELLLNNRKQIESYANQNVSLTNSDMVIAEYNLLVHKK